MNHELKLIVFDLIGTTIQDNQEVPEAFSEALSQHNIRITADQLRQARGASKREALRKLVPSGPHQSQIAESVYASFRERLIRRFEKQSPISIARAEEIFEWFRKQNVSVALNTGFDREITDLILASCGWTNGVVDGVVCVEDVSQGRPAPFLIFHAMELTRISSVENVANVGDTAIDLLAGFNAGVRWNIGVLSGAHTHAILEEAPHTHLLSSIAELPSIFG
jgi:phosphonatase-like hydrolase